METELKFQVPPERRAALHRAVATATVQTTRLQAVYADTEDLRLARAGLALRLRKEGRVWVQTLKGRGDGLMQRLEHELTLPAQRGVPRLDPSRHAGTEVGLGLARLLADGSVLQPLYRTDIQRLHRSVRFEGARIEIAYDRGQLLAQGRRAQVDEIEFELKSGPAAALPALAQRWAARHGLWWDSRTKSERGTRLALDVHRVPPTPPRRTPRHAGHGLRPGPGPAFRAGVMGALAQALPNAAELASGTGEAGHLRALHSALRRLRLRLTQAGCMAEVESLDHIRRRLAEGADDAQAVEGVEGAGAGAGAVARAGAAARHPELTALLLRSLTLALQAPP